MAPFIGRKSELMTLSKLLEKSTASMVVIKGRRRIGKSRLIQEFAKNMTFYQFSGVPPHKGSTSQQQRNAFAKQLQYYFKVPIKADNWWDLLWYLAAQTQQGRMVVLLDEISWMADKDPEFLGQLKTIWDTHFKQNVKLILVLCSSISSWVEKNILGSSAFMGRDSLTLTLKELPLNDCNLFWGKQNTISAYEKFKLLVVTGGVPRYLEEINPKISAEDNISDLCFQEHGILFNEFEKIFTDLFDTRSNSYKQIVYALSDGPLERSELLKKLNKISGGIISDYLNDLILAGFVSEDYVWDLSGNKTLKLKHFRLSDNYVRFYVNYILPNRERIEKGNFVNYSLANLPGITSIFGYQFENLVLHNRHLVKKLLNLSAIDIINDNPYFQHKTNRQQGCQIDYLIQTRQDCLYVCEIKFSKHPIDVDIVNQIKEKIARLSRPKYLSCRRVLIHVNGVTEALTDTQYFNHIIDFSQFLEYKDASNF